MAKIELPSFVSLHNEPNRIKKIVKTEHNLYCIEGDTRHTFDTVSKAYDHIVNNLNGIPVFNSHELHEMDETEQYVWEPNIYVETITIKNKPTTRVLISQDSSYQKKQLVKAYKQFLKTHEEWKKDPTNWATAWEWISQHPAFWHTLPNLSKYWQTNNGWTNHYLKVTQNKKKTFVTIEHGPYVDEEQQDETITPRKHPTHDPRLDTTASTYEEAVIKLAKKIHKHYNIKGEPRKL